MVLSAAAVVARRRREPPSTIEPANTWSPGALATGRDSPVTGAWFAAALPSMHDAVHGHPFAGADEDDVAGDDVGGRHRDFGAVAQHDGLGGRERHEAADGAARALQRGDLEPGAEAEEEDDEPGLRPLTDGGRAEGGQRHEHVHVDLAGAEAEEGGAGDVGAAGDHRRGEEPRRCGRRQRSGDEAGDDEGAGEQREEGAALAVPGDRRRGGRAGRGPAGRARRSDAVLRSTVS